MRRGVQGKGFLQVASRPWSSMILMEAFTFVDLLAPSETSEPETLNLKPDMSFLWVGRRNPWSLDNERRRHAANQCGGHGSRVWGLGFGGLGFRAL